MGPVRGKAQSTSTDGELSTPPQSKRRRRLTLKMSNEKLHSDRLFANEEKKKTLAEWVREHHDLPEIEWLVGASTEPLRSTYARAGDFYVCMPTLGDVARLRDLETEFVLDHHDLFSEEPWHSELWANHWCGLLNVVSDHTQARQAIAGIVQGNLPGHKTLKCMHAPKGCKQPTTVGYVHLTNSGKKNILDISHLKVQRQFRGRGLGALLIAGALRCAEMLGAKVEAIELVVLARNRPAVALYESLGFSVQRTKQKLVSGSSASLEWQQMSRRLDVSDASGAASLVACCEARASSACSREGGAQ